MAQEALDRLHALMVKATKDGRVRWAKTDSVFQGYVAKVGFDWLVEILRPHGATNGVEALVVRMVGQGSEFVGEKRFDGSELFKLAQANPVSTELAVRSIEELFGERKRPLRVEIVPLGHAQA